VCAIGIDQTEEHLLEEQTRRSERLASLGTLAAGLAHEIRNPLNAALLQLLLVERRVNKIEDEQATRAVESAKIVKDELTRLGILVEDFLAFARPTRLRLDSADLEKTAEAVIQLVAPEASEHGVSLVFERGQGVAARYDDERIRQVLHNLVRNAVEAADGGGAVRVQVLRERNRAVLEVRDTGNGPPEGLDLFQPFQTSKEGGTGLGLSIVHRIVTDHGGTIEHFRDHGETCFRIELPIDGPMLDGATSSV
jgi:signal transduction histidine kinase